jgi:hypothetical protein
MALPITATVSEFGLAQQEADILTPADKALTKSQLLLLAHGVQTEPPLSVQDLKSLSEVFGPRQFTAAAVSSCCCHIVCCCCCCAVAMTEPIA